jgi:hypothetical protein
MVPTSELLSAGTTLGVPLAIVRTVSRLGDDRVVLAECVGSPDSDDIDWVDPSRVRVTSVDLGSAIAAACRPDDDTPRAAWMVRGWLNKALDEVAEQHGRVTSFRQLKHWALSAVVHVVTETADVVLKQVPPQLAAEGPVTALLADLGPGAVPTVLTADSDRFVMETFGGTEGSVEADGLEALASLQQTATAHCDRLFAVGCRTQTASALALDIAALLAREDVLFERTWQLSTTDGRRPTRYLEPEDVAHLRGQLDRIAADAHRLDRSAPTTIVHGDFHPFNVARVDDRTVILDWGAAFLGDPRADLPTWRQLAPSDAGVDDYLAKWNTSVDDWDQVVYAAYLMNALTCATLADAVLDESARKDWSAGVQKRLIEALELMGR